MLVMTNKYISDSDVKHLFESIVSVGSEFTTYLDLVISPLMVEHLCHAAAYSANVPMRTLISQLVSYAFEMIRNRVIITSNKAILKYRDILSSQDKSTTSSQDKDISLSMMETFSRKDGFQKVCSERFYFPNLEKQLVVNLSAKLRKVQDFIIYLHIPKHLIEVDGEFLIVMSSFNCFVLSYIHILLFSSPFYYRLSLSLLL